LKRILCCLFLLLSCSSAEASISLLAPSQRNIGKFSQYAQVQSVTNSPVNTWAPACAVLKEKKIEGFSNKQAHLKGILILVFCGPLFFLVVLAIAYSGSSKRLSRWDKALIGITATVIILSLVGLKLVGLNRYAYINDYSFPEYLVSSTSTNIIVVHEKIDLPYKKFDRTRRALIFRDHRITSVRTDELATLLQAQAEEIRLFRQANPPQKAE
jgi:hypothetical protein